MRFMRSARSEEGWVRDAEVASDAEVIFFDLDDTLIRFPNGHAKLLLLWQSARHLGTLFSEGRPQFATPFALRVLVEARRHLVRERAHSLRGDPGTIETSIHEHWMECLREALERVGRVEVSDDELARVSREFFEGPFARVALRTIHPFAGMIGLVRRLREEGRTVVLATNPFVPRLGVELRLARAGLAGHEFRHLTCAENSRFLKPSIHYYSDLLAHMGLRGREVAMIGNDPVRDGAARQAGIRTLIVNPRKDEATAAAEAAAFLGWGKPA